MEECRTRETEKQNAKPGEHGSEIKRISTRRDTWSREGHTKKQSLIGRKNI